MSTNLVPTAPKQATFEVFRYQLVVDKTLQQGLFDKYNSAEDFRADKNNILQSILTNDNFRFRSNASEITSKLMYTKGTMSYFKIGVKRKTKVFKKDFSEDVIENYPNVILAFNNHPDVQKIAIQSNKSAFNDCKTVAHIIQKSLEEKATNYNLNFFLEPMFDKKEFWKLVERYPKQIKQVTFDLVTPNLANISKNLDLNLKELYEDTNTQRTKVELNSDPDSYLDIKEKSKFINSLVDYSADGGGDIYMRVNGIRKKLHTAQAPTEFNIEDQLLKGNDWAAFDDMFKEILL